MNDGAFRLLGKMQALGIMGGFMFLVFIGFVIFICSGIILAALYQWCHINLFFYYEGIPLGMLALTMLFFFIIIYIIVRNEKLKKKI